MKTSSIPKDKSTFLFRFLINSEFRMGRYILLIAVLTVIAFNQVIFMYQSSLDILGKWVYLLFGFILFILLLLAFCNLHYLIPKYLMHKKYFTYFMILARTIIIVLLLMLLQEYIVYKIWPETCEREPFFDASLILSYLSSFLMNTLCLTGISMTVLLKLWITDNQRIMDLEKKQMQSELTQLKEQISPELLFKTLDASGHLATEDSHKASAILMKLSQLLRYQLYDCAREQTLLSAEIKFLTNYLTLEQLLSDKFSCTFSSYGDVNRTFVPPLLFMPFIQHVIEQINLQKKIITLDICFEVDEEFIAFSCICPGININKGKDMQRSIRRLILLYNNNYCLTMKQDIIRLQLKKEMLWNKK